MAKLQRIHGLGKGSRIRLTIETLTPGGDGVGHFEGVAIFVGRVAPGDVVDVDLFDVRKSFARGKVVTFHQRSADRIEPACPVFDRCGGCQWQHVSYEAQLEAKQTIVRQALRHIDDIDLQSTLPAPQALNYRNKAQFPVQRTGKGRLVAGYYEEGSHRIVDLNSCPVQPEPLDLVLREVKRLLIEYRVSAYREDTHNGLIRHICARESDFNKDVLLTLVLNSTDEEFADEQLAEFRTIATTLMESIPSIKGVCLNFNSEKGNKIFGDETICIKGALEIEEVLRSLRSDRPTRLREGIRFRLSSQSFFQVNTKQAANLFDEVYDQVDTLAKRFERPLKVLDVYAGVGTIAMWVADLAENVVAVEDQAPAVRDGLSAVALNKVNNITFEEGRAEQVLTRMAKEGAVFDVAIIDPPRKGASSQVLEALLKLQPTSIIYVSCNPQTLARDLKILQDGVLEDGEGKQVYTGYKTLRVKPIDLFPQTYHIESVATLERYADGAFRNLEEI